MAIKVLWGSKILKWQKVGAAEAKYGVKVFGQKFLNPNNGNEDLYVYAYKKPGTTILAIDGNQDLIMVVQYKQAMDAVVLEFPAGLMNEADPTEFAKKELLAETGFQAGEMRVLQGGAFSLAPRKIQSMEWSIAAINCQSVQEPKPDPGEVIQVVSVPQEDFWHMVGSGEINSAGTIITAMKALQAQVLSMNALSHSITTV